MPMTYEVEDFGFEPKKKEPPKEDTMRFIDTH
jgi:hypothetical protein